MTRRAGIVVLIFACTGCSVGPQIHEFDPAHEPAGIRAEVTTRSAVPGEKKLSGEILAITDAGVLLLRESDETPRIVQVPYEVLSTVDPAQRTAVRVSTLAVEERPVRVGRLRLLARYPQGITPELLQALLRAYGQPALHVVGDTS